MKIKFSINEMKKDELLNKAKRLFNLAKKRMGIPLRQIEIYFKFGEEGKKYSFEESVKIINDYSKSINLDYFFETESLISLLCLLPSSQLYIFLLNDKINILHKIKYKRSTIAFTISLEKDFIYVGNLESYDDDDGNSRNPIVGMILGSFYTTAKDVLNKKIKFEAVGRSKSAFGFNGADEWEKYMERKPKNKESSWVGEL